jgi:exosortase/archaeosortase family protein
MDSHVKSDVAAQSQFRRFGNIVQEFTLQTKIAIIAVSAIAIFSQDLYVIGSDALNSDYFKYVLAVPFFGAYLIYRKRKVLAAVMSKVEDRRQIELNAIVGVSALLAALVVYLYGTNTSYPLDYHLIALEIFLGAATLLLFNWTTLRILLVPILLITTCLPYAIELSLSSWLALSWASAVPAQWVLQAMGLNVGITTNLSGNAPTLLLTTPAGEAFSFVIGVASSGTYSVVGFTLFAAFAAFISKGAIWKKILLFGLAYPLLVLVNFVREVILVGVTQFWGIAAFNLFHETSGLLLISLVTLVLVILGDRLLNLEFIPTRSLNRVCSLCRDEFHKGHSFCINCGRYLQSLPRKIASKEVFAIAAILIIVFVFLYSLEPAVAVSTTPTSIPPGSISSANANVLLPQIHGWSLAFSYRDNSTQSILDEDAALIYSYTSQNQSANGEPIALYVTIQISVQIHTPESSLVAYPVLFGHPQATVFEDHDTEILANPLIVGRYFVYQRIGDNLTEAYLYWNTRALFNFGSYSDFRNVQIAIWQVTSTLASNGVIDSPTDYAAVLQLYLSIAHAISLYWQPVSSNSAIQGIVGRWPAPILGLVMVPAAIAGGKTAVERRKLERSEADAYRKLLPKQNLVLVDCIQVQDAASDSIRGKWFSRLFRAAKKGKRRGATLEEIISVYKARTGREITLKDAAVDLAYAYHSNLARSEIIDNGNDEPVQVWHPIVAAPWESEWKKFVSEFKEMFSFRRGGGDL